MTPVIDVKERKVHVGILTEKRRIIFHREMISKERFVRRNDI